MPAPPEVVTALWLLPEGEAAEYLAEKMQQLAAQYAVPIFAPHLTLGLDAASLLERVNLEPFELTVVGVEAAPAFTKTLFIRCALTPQLADLRDLLGLSVAGYDPHVSLLYCDLSLTEKLRFAATVDFPRSSASRPRSNAPFPLPALSTSRIGKFLRPRPSAAC